MKKFLEVFGNNPVPEVYFGVHMDYDVMNSKLENNQIDISECHQMLFLVIMKQMPKMFTTVSDDVGYPLSSVVLTVISNANQNLILFKRNCLTGVLEGFHINGDISGAFTDYNFYSLDNALMMTSILPDTHLRNRFHQLPIKHRWDWLSVNYKYMDTVLFELGSPIRTGYHTVSDINNVKWLNGSCSLISSPLEFSDRYYKRVIEPYVKSMSGCGANAICLNGFGGMMVIFVPENDTYWSVDLIVLDQVLE